MELLTAVFEKDFADDPDKQFFLCSCDSWESAVKNVQPSSKHFGLLLVGDAKAFASDGLAEIANSLQERGLACLCAWGGDCRRVEDIFDEVYVERELDGEVQTGREDTLMTSSHPEESLSDAIWFFGYCAWPTKYFASDCRDWIVAVIADKNLESYVRDNFNGILAREQD